MKKKKKIMMKGNINKESTEKRWLLKLQVIHKLINMSN